MYPVPMRRLTALILALALAVPAPSWADSLRPTGSGGWGRVAAFKANSPAWMAGSSLLPDQRYARFILESGQRLYGPSLEPAEKPALLSWMKEADPKIHAHMLRVGILSALLAQAMGLPPEQARLASWAGRFHDVGKYDPQVHAAVSDTAKELSAQMRAAIKTHPERGTEILARQTDMPEDILRAALAGALHHHEDFDGGGYPFGQRGEEIPLLARIVAAADFLDALLENRPHRAGFTIEESLAVITERAPTRLDPKAWSALQDLAKAAAALEVPPGRAPLQNADFQPAPARALQALQSAEKPAWDERAGLELASFLALPESLPAPAGGWSGAMVLDMGNVAVGLNPGRALRELRKLGLSPALSQRAWDVEKGRWALPSARQFEEGRWRDDPPAFLAALRQELGLSPEADEAALGRAWGAIVDGRVRDLVGLDFIARLRRAGFLVVAASNINPLHLRRTLAHPRYGRLLRSLDLYFASYALGATKPEAGFYRLVEEALRRCLGALPSPILFADDSSANVAVAAARGWHGLVFRGRRRFISELRRLARENAWKSLEAALP